MESNVITDDEEAALYWAAWGIIVPLWAMKRAHDRATKKLDKKTGVLWC